MQDTVFTIGHSTHSEERFIGLLLQHEVTALCDVRSAPFSRINPQFNRNALEAALEQRGIVYRFLGKELGARSGDPSCYESGKVQYSRLAETDLFRYGIKRVLRGMKDGFRIALMCAEKEPLDCHRTILVARHLALRGVSISHILADGRLEIHEATLARLARLLNLPEDNMFSTREELLDTAYRKQEERIAYQAPAPAEGILRGAAG